MLKSCFDCDSETIITDVIYEVKYSTVKITRDWKRKTYILEDFVVYDKIVEYTCRQCGTKWYVTVGEGSRIQEARIF